MNRLSTADEIVLEGFLALFRNPDKFLGLYQKKIAAMDEEYEAKAANNLTLDAAKAVVDQECDQHRTRVMEAIEQEVAQRAAQRTNIDEAITTLQHDRQDLLNDLAGKRAELAAMDGEKLSKAREAQAELEQVAAQVESEKTKLKALREELAAVVRQHSGVSA